ncbi:hypothetical protein AWB81_07821 [Caballeronia arationis]|nr:hypothetical protein AWB81_07821 [Caballeronia arationis]
MNVLHAGLPELAMKPRVLKHILTLLDDIGVDIDTVQGMAFRVRVLKQPTGADRVIQDADTPIHLPAAHEAPHECRDRIRREELAEVQPTRGGQLALMGNRRRLRSQTSDRTQRLVPIWLKRKQISLHELPLEIKRPAGAGRNDGKVDASVPVARGEVFRTKLTNEEGQRVAHVVSELELPLVVEHHDLQPRER